jgi:hypothetical protein
MLVLLRRGPIRASLHRMYGIIMRGASSSRRGRLMLEGILAKRQRRTMDRCRRLVLDMMLDMLLALLLL